MKISSCRSYNSLDTQPVFLQLVFTDSVYLSQGKSIQVSHRQNSKLCCQCVGNIFNFVVMYIRCSCNCALLLTIFGTLPLRHTSYKYSFLLRSICLWSTLRVKCLTKPVHLDQFSCVKLTSNKIDVVFFLLLVFWTQASVKCMRVPYDGMQVLEVFVWVASEK